VGDASNLPPDASISVDDAGVYQCQGIGGATRPCQCNDGTDNDGDGAIDAGDPDCSGAYDDTENPTMYGMTECTDGVDNDGDGKIDGNDPECVSALDNDESSFATGIPGDNMDKCKQDCFFDGDSGAGNDGCNWDLGCDPNHDAYGCRAVTGGRCEMAQTMDCVTFCTQFTPNGCDCFGCCTVYDANGVGHDVRLLPTCSVDKVNDPVACPPCQKVTSCDNPCDRCELCLGRDPSDLPPDCVGQPGDGGVGDGGGAADGGGGGLRCPPGQIACGPGGIDPNQCPPNTFCVTGCCIPTIGLSTGESSRPARE
jgi:hypothetical protein